MCDYSTGIRNQYGSWWQELGELRVIDTAMHSSVMLCYDLPAYPLMSGGMDYGNCHDPTLLSGMHRYGRSIQQQPTCQVFPFMCMLWTHLNQLITTEDLLLPQPAM